MYSSTKYVTEITSSRSSGVRDDNKHGKITKINQELKQAHSILSICYLAILNNMYMLHTHLTHLMFSVHMKGGDRNDNWALGTLKLQILWQREAPLHWVATNTMLIKPVVLYTSCCFNCFCLIIPNCK